MLLFVLIPPHVVYKWWSSWVALGLVWSATVSQLDKAKHNCIAMAIGDLRICYFNSGISSSWIDHINNLLESRRLSELN